MQPAQRIGNDAPGDPVAPPVGQRQPGTAPSASQAAGGFDFNHPTIISLLYLASYITGITGIVGVVLAYVWRDEAAGWEQSHLTYLIRTFWIGLLGAVIGTILTIILIGVLVLLAVAVWVAVRSVMSLVRAQKREPMPEPYTWLI